MKRRILIGIGIVLVGVVGFTLYGYFTTRNLSPRQITDFSANGLDIKISYGRPSKRGRMIFGDEKDKALQPYGKYWRLGANEATEITFSKNFNFVGKPVNAGTYRMYAVPNAAIWQVSLNSELGKWGYSEPDYSMDVVKVDVPSDVAPADTEQFIINFSSDSSTVNMDFVWEKTLVRVPITLQ